MTMDSINGMKLKKRKFSVVLEVKGIEPEGFQTALENQLIYWSRAAIFHVSSRISSPRDLGRNKEMKGTYCASNVW